MSSKQYAFVALFDSAAYLVFWVLAVGTLPTLLLPLYFFARCGFAKYTRTEFLPSSVTRKSTALFNSTVLFKIASVILVVSSAFCLLSTLSLPVMQSMHKYQGFPLVLLIGDYIALGFYVVLGSFAYIELGFWFARYQMVFGDSPP